MKDHAKKIKGTPKMKSGKGWSLQKGDSGRAFSGTLRTTLHIGGQRLAIFSVPKKFKA
ncbi:hypothetical protein [Occallatibacter savannae]|uniref:hypothetical protein n=1 Tax=Occallatibacter savannae TaxID=1002691 RepID=UPI0013A590F2|nr:hypothetical protein [Occallatibacter savannae]